MAEKFSSLILITFMIFSMKTTSAAGDTFKSEKTSYPSECSYPCLPPPPTPPTTMNCPPPPAPPAPPAPAIPSPPSGSGSYYYPPPPPAPPGYYYNPPFPYYLSPPQSYGNYYGPPPPNPILPYFPFYFKSPPPPPGFSSAVASDISATLIPCLIILFGFHCILLGNFDVIW